MRKNRVEVGKEKLGRLVSRWGRLQKLTEVVVEEARKQRKEIVNGHSLTKTTEPKEASD